MKYINSQMYLELVIGNKIEKLYSYGNLFMENKVNSILKDFVPNNPLYFTEWVIWGGLTYLDQFSLLVL